MLQDFPPDTKQEEFANLGEPKINAFAYEYLGENENYQTGSDFLMEWATECRLQDLGASDVITLSKRLLPRNEKICSSSTNATACEIVAFSVRRF